MGSRRPLPVAVVIPAYNAELFLNEALESVRAQTAPPSEVIVVDDGSSDRTLEIARRPGVTLLRQNHAGPSEARNVAIRATAQPWIAFLDADDVWNPDKLEAQWDASQACPEVGVVFSDFTEFDATGSIGPTVLSQKAHYPSVKRTEIAPGVMRCDTASLGQQVIKGNFLAPSTLLVRRDLLLQIGLFDPKVWGREDTDCVLRLLVLSPAAVVERSLMGCRLHESNLTRDRYRIAVAGIELAKRVKANPDRYPPGADAAYQRELPRCHLNAGRFAEERGDIRCARRHYLQSWRAGGGIVAAGSAVLSFLPAPVRRVARVIRHRVLPD
jgi:glycosyltransferase involved in cell wall biosynthesis